ncbi:MAG: DUF4359 domain-containing protein [Nitrospiraceae bacterium]
MSTRALLIMVAFLAVCVTLAATNPTTTDYGTFLQASLSQALERMDQREPTNQRKMISELLTVQGKRVIESLIRSNTVRRNYGLFSIFETHAFEVRVVVLGVGKHFFPLDDQKAMAKKLGQLVL